MSGHRDLNVVVASVHLDQQGRSPAELLASWRDFARPQAEAAACRPGLRVTMLLAGWDDGRGEASGIPCRFVSEATPFTVLPGGRRLRRIPRRLYAAIRECSPDLIHFEGFAFPRELHALTRAMRPTPMVMQDHGGKMMHGWRRLAYRWGFAGLTGALFTAREQAEPFKAAGILRGNLPIFEVLEGSSPFGPGDQAAARHATGLSGNPCLLWLGNLDSNKDPLTVLDAVALASEECPEITLFMCFRRAPLLDAVRHRLEDPRLAGRVKLIGEIPYPRTEPFLQAADFVVQASHAEGSGFAVIEALACGATPIVTDIPSFRRLTGDGRTGALVPPDDPAGFSRAIVEWSRRDRQALRHEARRHFEDSLAFDAVGRELRDAYEQAWALR